MKIPQGGLAAESELAKIIPRSFQSRPTNLFRLCIGQTSIAPQDLSYRLNLVTTLLYRSNAASCFACSKSALLNLHSFAIFLILQ